MKDYTPEPIDTSGIELDPELEKLREQLARNAHDVWARERTAQGWTFGPKRDDATKQHPCLIPYEDLPESEKVHDRNTAIQTLKAIIKLGYRIERGPRKT